MKKRIDQLCRTVLLVAVLMMSHANGICSQTDKLNFPQQSLPDRMNKIAETYHEKIVINRSETTHIITPALNASGKTVKQAVESSLQGTGYTYAVNNNLITIYKASSASAPVAAPAQTALGTLRGKVLDETGDILPGATVQVAGGGQGTATDADGGFSLKLPAGTYTLEIGFMGYQTQRVTDVKVVSGKTTPLDITLGQANTELDEVVVTATYNQASAQGLYARQKNIAAMSDGVSADLIKKTSDNNVAQVLKRVSGVTIDNGKYVTVRGMSERYNNVQLNGASLPSTEPNRRNFSFDVIPTGLVDNVTIAKTFTPDLPGEFTGGLVEVNTLAVPDKRFLNLSLGTGWNSISTGKKFKSNKRYGSDYWRGEIKQRQWYVGRTLEQTNDNIAKAESMNSYGMRVFKAAPTQSYSLTAGLPIDLGSAGNLGMVAAVTYRHDENTEHILEGHFINRDSLYRPGYKYKFTTAVGAVANIGWQKAGHKVTWRNLWNNRFSHSNQERYTWESYGSYPTYTAGSLKSMYEQYSVPLISNLWQTQLDGEHKLFDNKLIATWSGSVNSVTRTNPDDRFALGAVVHTLPEGTDFVEWTSGMWDTNISDNHTMYSRLKEYKKNAAINLEHPFVVKGNRQSIKAGYMGTFRNATYEQQYLKARANSTIKQKTEMYTLPIEEFFAPEYFGGNPLYYEVTSLEGERTDYYKGKQNIHACYVMGEFSFLRKLRLITGIRAEKTDMTTTTTEIKLRLEDMKEIYEEQDSIVPMKRTDWLPAATLIYSPLPDLNMRAAYSKTLARPDFRELSQNRYYNVDDRVKVINPYAVEVSHIHNWDVRAEWYPRPGEVLSIGYFHKKFIKPVEMVVRMKPDQQNFDMFNINLDESIAKGIELNWRKSLGFMAPSAAFLKDMYFTGNYTWMKANVTYNSKVLTGGILTEEQIKEYKDYERSRPLQGLSPYTINLGLAYEGSRLGAAINYNKNGRKLVFAGDFTKFDQYEAPRDVLDVQLSARFLQEKLELKLNASDILNQDIIIYRNTKAVEWSEDNPAPNGGTSGTGYLDLTEDMNYNPGDWVMSRIKKGVGFSVSASWKF